MARRKKAGSIILRTSLETSGVNYQSTSIDISALVDVPKGEVLLIKRAWITFSSDNNNNCPSGTDWPVAGATGADSQVTAMANALTQTTMTPMANADAIVKSYLVGHVDPNQNWDLFEIINLMRPQEYSDGMYIATDQIHCACDVGVALQQEIECSFVFECETVTLSREQALDLAVSLQQ